MSSPSSALKGPALTDEQCKELRSKLDADWHEISVGGKQIGDDEMRAYLDFIRFHGPAETREIKCSPQKDWPIYKVSIGQLPKNLRLLIRQIRDDLQVVDKSSDKTSVTPVEHGGMRAWHQNDLGMLPRQDAPAPMNAYKASKYQDYIEKNKRLPSKQVKKEVEQKYTGYVEFTLVAWRSAQGRLIYDYYNNEFYLTPGHYAAGNTTRNAFYFVVCD